jgi:hypothetical protein
MVESMVMVIDGAWWAAAMVKALTTERREADLPRVSHRVGAECCFFPPF